MKMKLAQRMALKYYTAKFRALSLISHRKAAESVFTLFCTPYSGKPKRKAPAVFAQAEKLTFGFNELQLHGWRWKPRHPNGKKILVVHGFDSCSYRFDRYIMPLNHAGFEVVAFDAQGHGISEGKTINALLYSQAILKIEERFGSFYGIMAHSLGGLATALAFEQLPRQEERRLVLVAPTTETTTAIDNFFKVIPVTGKVRTAFHQVIEEVGEKPVEYYSVSRVVKHIKAPVLWIHDEDDRICPYCDTLPVQELSLPNVEFFITKGLGHSGIYRQDGVFNKIMRFFDGNTEDRNADDADPADLR
jgi:pimeloyl-ACP methyl ester carboxylesterase